MDSVGVEASEQSREIYAKECIAKSSRREVIADDMGCFMSDKLGPIAFIDEQ